MQAASTLVGRYTQGQLCHIGDAPPCTKRFCIMPSGSDRLRSEAVRPLSEHDPLHFVLHLRGDFQNHPSPENIGQITDELKSIFEECGIKPTPEPTVQWRAKPNNHWMKDHVSFDEHRSFDYMDLKPFQTSLGEAYLTYEVPAVSRDKLLCVSEKIGERVQAYHGLAPAR